MHRRGFFRALAGVLVAAPAATALVLAAPQTVQKFEPRPSVPGDQFVGKLLAHEFLRSLINHLHGIERKPMLDAQAVLKMWNNGWDWWHPIQIGVNIEWHPELTFDQLCETYVRAAASAVAARLRDEYRRGARGLQFCRLPIATGPTMCECVASPEHQVNARLVVATLACLDEDSLLEWVTCGRFDVAYMWDQHPRRERRSFALDPARLPA